MFDFNMRPGASVWPPFTNPGRTYKFYTGKPVLPFGYGLSYSRFTYAILPDRSLSHVSLQQRSQSILGHITVSVTNAGSVDADDVLLGFISPPAASGRPLKQLFEFTRVHVKAGQTVTGVCIMRWCVLVFSRVRSSLSRCCSCPGARRLQCHPRG